MPPEHQEQAKNAMPMLSISESSNGQEHALQWKTYSVSRSAKAPLLHFITSALEMRACRLVHVGEADQAPFYIVFETPGGERHGILAYAFFANSVVTRNRPQDEHRFQIKYGSNLKGVLDVAVDPYGLITTILLGIDLERQIFIAVDPRMNTPAPMSRSVEFKQSHVEQILDAGWLAWERDRRPPRTKDRPAVDLADFRTEILIGARQDRLLDLILLERIALGLDPGQRHLVADRLPSELLGRAGMTVPHKLLEELRIEPEALFDLIEGASRLKMAVRGWVAETKLVAELERLPGVSSCRRIEAEGQPDVELRWKDGAPVLIECKNVLRKRDAQGRPRVDFQRTRASLGNPCSRYYTADDFNVLAACLHAVEEDWTFRFALTVELPPHKKCHGRIASMISVLEPLFTPRPGLLFDRHAAGIT